MDLRSEMALTMEQIGITVECHHHEVATAGQCEIDMRFDTLVAMADKLIKYKYVVKNVAAPHGKTATFMPKPLFGDNGSGMHVHQSIWDGDKPIFGDPAAYGGLSQTARYYIGGLLKHAPALLAFAAPTTNSYHRLVPGYEAPVNLAWSLRNRSAAVRIPMYSDSPKAEAGRVPLPRPVLQPLPRLRRHADGRPRRHPQQDRPGRSGRQEHLRPAARGAGRDPDRAGLARTMRLAALEADHEFLLEGDVFTADFIENYLDVQAREGGRRDPPAPAPLRVRPLLRHLRALRAQVARPRGSPPMRNRSAVGPDLAGWSPLRGESPGGSGQGVQTHVGRAPAG